MGVSVQGSVQEGLYPVGLCPWGLCLGVISRRVSICGSLSGRSLSRGLSRESLSGGLGPGGSVHWVSVLRKIMDPPLWSSLPSRVSVQGSLCPGGFCPRGLCPGEGSLSKERVSVQGGVSLPEGSLFRKGVSV